MESFAGDILVLSVYKLIEDVVESFVFVYHHVDVSNQMKFLLKLEVYLGLQKL